MNGILPIDLHGEIQRRGVAQHNIIFLEIELTIVGAGWCRVSSAGSLLSPESLLVRELRADRQPITIAQSPVSEQLA